MNFWQAVDFGQGESCSPNHTRTSNFLRNFSQAKGNFSQPFWQAVYPSVCFPGSKQLQLRSQKQAMRSSLPSVTQYQSDKEEGGMEMEKDQQTNRIRFQAQGVAPLESPSTPNSLFPSSLHPGWFQRIRELGCSCISLCWPGERVLSAAVAQDHPRMSRADATGTGWMVMKSIVEIGIHRTDGNGESGEYTTDFKEESSNRPIWGKYPPKQTK